MNKFLQKITAPFLWLTKPSVKLVQEGDLRRARLLSALLLPMIVFFLTASILTADDEVLVLLIMGGISFLLYLLSRTQFYKLAAVAILLVFTLFMFMALEEGTVFSNERLVSEMKFMAIPLLFGGLCLSFRFMLPYNILVIIGLSQLKRLFPIDQSYILTEGVVFVSIVAALGLVASSVLVRQQQQIDRERRKSDELLKNILPLPIAEELKENGQVVPRKIENATILFADIVGFTPYAAKVNALELVDLLNEVFSGIDGVVEKYGLEKIKTIGDAYMIAGGVPLPQEDHCEKTARAAQEIIALTEELAMQRKIDLQIRIGMDSGPVVAGVIGTKKFIYDIWGDAVNLANRLESSGIPGKIQVSRRVAEKLHPQFKISKRGEVEIKGRGKMMTYILD